ncbi:hypothetical protein GCM10011516_13990 [Sphingobacterium cellulitidis]|uniref:Secreted protein n=2 Tax=Sphingobacteriaceae TaxID=84566 RepID=A0A8H9KVE8_9SPHI|nr:hypothetical protein GCM10011516_13990 [Sphingobacterium soli]
MFLMKKILQLSFVFIAFIASTNFAHAQLPSQHAIGARFGSATGLTYRYTMNPNKALEGILSIQSNSEYSRFRLVGLYENHLPLYNDFSWFWGFGGSVGSYSGKAYTNKEGQRFDKYSEMALSIDGIVGVEYKIPQAPLALSLDIKPYFDFLQESGFRIWDGVGFSIRYTF